MFAWLANHCGHHGKACKMSFKSFSTTQATPAKDKSVDKPKDAPANDQSAVQSDKATDANAASSKS